MLRYCVRINVLLENNICVSARSPKDAVRKACRDVSNKFHINQLLDACYREIDGGTSKHSSRKKERRQIKGILCNPINVINQSVTSVKEI